MWSCWVRPASAKHIWRSPGRQGGGGRLLRVVPHAGALDDAPDEGSMRIAWNGAATTQSIPKC